MTFVYFLFFFSSRRRHTRWPRDWSSDVCSSDLLNDNRIDGRFIRDIERDPANPIIVESLVKLAALKGIGCIGEWIESDDILATARVLGVGYGQGFHLHKPEPIALPTT